VCEQSEHAYRPPRPHGCSRCSHVPHKANPWYTQRQCVGRL